MMYLKDDKYASYKLLGAEFAKLGYTVTESKRDGRRMVTYTSPSGKEWTTRAASLRYPCISEQARYIACNKEIAYKFAAENGVSIPYTRYLRSHEDITADESTALLKEYRYLIVKPSNSLSSRGLTLKIHTARGLKAAITKARKVAPTVLVQEQVEGEEIRFAVMNGKVASALLRQTARVVGDGTSTVAELIAKENHAREALRFDYLSYPQLDTTIIDESFLTSEQVPAKGEVVELNRATMIKNGCSVYDVLPRVHPSYVRTVESLSGKLDTNFIVVDMFVKDYTKRQTDDNYWFIEFNVAPALRLFYGCRDGKMFDIVPKLVKNIDVSLHTKGGKRPVVGSFETVVLPDYSETPLVAKIDTGAYSGALYATHVRKKIDETGRPYVTFAFCGDRKQMRTSYDFYQRKVRSAHGHTKDRYVVRTYINIQDRLYGIDIGLSNRSSMKYPMLIGRKFLRDNRIIVDVAVNEDMDYEKERLG